MGSPKALLDWHGRTFLEQSIGLFAPYCSPVIAVLGHQAATIRARVRQSAPAIFVENPDPDRGMLSSLQCGLRALPADTEAFLFSPVDLPAIEGVTIERLCAALETAVAATSVVVTRYGGRNGHPVACRARLIAEFLALPPAAMTSEVIHRHRDHTVYLDVADAGVVADVDYPEDYRRLIEAAPARER